MMREVADAPLRAAIYLRISQDRELDGLAIERQREDCENVVAQHKWTVAPEHVYTDQSISATDASVNRPAYDRLVRDFDAREWDALVCWDLDRLTRQPRQLEDWIDRAESRGLRIVTANGEADLGTDSGRLFARVKAAVARAEVERKSARQSRAHRQRAAMGRPPKGVRALGYSLDGTVRAGEAEAVRAIFTAFNAGASLRSIARALLGVTGPDVPAVPALPSFRTTLMRERNEARAREGLPERPVPPERPWNPSTVQGILRNPRYAGYSILTPRDARDGTMRRDSAARIVRDATGAPVHQALADRGTVGKVALLA